MQGYIERMDRITTTRIAVAALALGVMTADAAAQQPPAGPTIEQRIGSEVGPVIVRAAMLAAQLESLKQIIEQRDKTIADLKARTCTVEPPK